jgi:hypothetical protein
VQNPNTQQGAPGATVVLIPQEQERRDQTTFYRTIGTDQSGNFTIKNVVPGEYRIYAWEDIEPGAYYDPDFIKPLEANGEKVSIAENGNQSVQLKLIPSADSAAR